MAALEDWTQVSVLFNEPKLLKWGYPTSTRGYASSFSALQRAEIAEMDSRGVSLDALAGFSALQRAEIAEMIADEDVLALLNCFSALQRAEIAEITVKISPC